MSLYQIGMGYRAITHELSKRGICVDWTTVRRVVKAKLGETLQKYGSKTNSATILPLHRSRKMTQPLSYYR